MTGHQEQLELIYEHADEAQRLENEAAAATSREIRNRMETVSHWLVQRWVRDFGALSGKSILTGCSRCSESCVPSLAPCAWTPLKCSCGGATGLWCWGCLRHPRRSVSRASHP